MPGAKLSTTGIGLRARTVWRNDENVLAGYEADTTLRLTHVGIEQVSEVLGAAVAAGGDALRIHSVQAEVSDPSLAYATARDLAFADARAKAEQLAALAGCTLGKALRVKETTQGSPLPILRVKAADMAASSMPVVAGEQELSANVEVCWELLDRMPSRTLGFPAGAEDGFGFRCPAPARRCPPRPAHGARSGGRSASSHGTWMNPPRAPGFPLEPVHQGVEHLVADEGAGGIGNLRPHLAAGLAAGARCTVPGPATRPSAAGWRSRRSAPPGKHLPIDGLLARVVRDPGIHVVDCHFFQAQGVPARGQPQADHHVRLVFVDQLVEPLRRQGKDARQFRGPCRDRAFREHLCRAEALSPGTD